MLDERVCAKLQPFGTTCVLIDESVWSIAPPGGDVPKMKIPPRAMIVAEKKESFEDVDPTGF
jgi:hypothetical protein